MPRTPETCPHCGADVPPRAKACPECGSSEETGWSEESTGGSLDLPDEDFNYDDFVKREFEGGGTPRGGLKWYWVATGLALIVAFVYMFIRIF